jgi:hypothetical protein
MENGEAQAGEVLCYGFLLEDPNFKRGNLEQHFFTVGSLATCPFA